MQQIADWLEKLGMSEYTERFAENDIDFTILGDLTDQDLEKIGVASLGHRRKLLRAIADLKDAKNSEPSSAVAPATSVAPTVLDSAERRQPPQPRLFRRSRRRAVGGAHPGSGSIGCAIARMMSRCRSAPTSP
jgi:hypothetical protein